MSLVVVTDSTSDITASLAKAHGIEVVPLWIIFGQQRFLDGVDIQRSDFYSRLKNDRDHPRTEAGDVAAFTKVFERLVAAGHDVIAPVLASTLSETYKNAAVAAQPFGGKVRVFDSRTFSGGLFLHARMAARMAAAGASSDDVMAAMERSREKQIGHFIMPDMNYLARSGRVNKAIATLGTVLKISPVLRITPTGAVENAAQTRTFDKAKELLIEVATRGMEGAGSMGFASGHANDPAGGEALAVTLRAKLGAVPKFLEVYEGGPSVGSNGGPGALAIYSMPV